MATSPEPKWRTRLWVVGTLLTIVLTATGIATNVFGLLDRGKTGVAATSKDTTEDTTKAALHEAEKQAARWLAALSARDVDQLVSLSEPPFFLDQNTILLSKPDIRAKYNEWFSGSPRGGSSGQIQIDKITPQTIGELKETGWNPGNDRLMNKLRLTDDDIVVSIVTNGEVTLLFFRRSGAKTEMAGMWN